MSVEDPDVAGIPEPMKRPVDPSVWTHGRVVRTARASPRLAYETLWLDLGSRDRDRTNLSIDEQIANSEGEAIVGEQAFRDQPPLGPITLWVRELSHGPSEAEALAQLDGNLKPDEDPVDPPPLEFIDATAVEPLPDSEVWSCLARLDGKPTYAAIDKVAVQLAREEEHYILALAQGTMRLMQSLDRPDLDTRWIDSQGRRCAVPLLDAWRRGAVLAGGPQAYADALLAGRDAKHPAPSDGSWAVPHIAGFALSKRLRRDVLITTSWSQDDGANASEWGDVIAADPPWEVPADIAREEEQRARIQEEVWRAATGDDSNYLPRRWFGIRYLLDDGAVTREIIQLVTDTDGTALATAERAIDLTTKSLGGRWIGPVELVNPHLIHPMSGPIYEIKRRFRGGVGAYREKYGV